MTTREKVIVAAACIAVVGGAVTYFQPFLAPAGQSATSVAAAADSAFVERVRQQLDAARLTDAERYVLDAAQAAWSPRPPVARKAVSAAAVAASPVVVFRYTGFVNMGAEHFAIINGHEYRRGDVLQGGAGVVDHIEADHVVLLLENGSKRDVIPFHKPVMKGEQK